VRVLALDIGQRRIGVAVSDPSGTLARSLTVVRRASRREDFAAIAELVREWEVGRVVVGHPRSLDGTVGRQARQVERYAHALADVLDVPVALWDERYSTVEAERLMVEAGRKPSRDRHWIDAVAAAVILQDYLESMTNEQLSMSNDR